MMHFTMETLSSCNYFCIFLVSTLRIAFTTGTPQLRYLLLANNDLVGAIPASLCRAINLEILDISGIKLSNIIPPCLVNDIDGLQVLNLGKNNISGRIPDTFSSNCHLQTLDLGKNNLRGVIPPWLANCLSLAILNVGGNKIEDKFPCMVPPSLRVLVLRSNRFYGAVSPCGRSWPNLQIIDIASNNFSGSLDPANFLGWGGMMQDDRLRSDDAVSNSYYEERVKVVNFKVTLPLTFKGLEWEVTRTLMIMFTSIDFSCNNFQGEIPHSIGDLGSLHVLNLSHNALTGTIQKSFGNLTQLESLDLSINFITGLIPRELASLTFLSDLNLSYNMPVGAIPKGSQLQTFSSSSFGGNPGLCGFPLEKKCGKTLEIGMGHGGEAHSFDEEEIKWFFVSVALGFGVGFGSAIWLMFGCESIEPMFSKKLYLIIEYMCINQQRKRRRTQK